jgi:hypothetical protein
MYSAAVMTHRACIVVDARSQEFRIATYLPDRTDSDLLYGCSYSRVQVHTASCKTALRQGDCGSRPGLDDDLWQWSQVGLARCHRDVDCLWPCAPVFPSEALERRGLFNSKYKHRLSNVMAKKTPAFLALCLEKETGEACAVDISGRDRRDTVIGHFTY